MNWRHDALRWLAFGRTGTGKTTLLLDELKRRPVPFLFFFDSPDRQFSERSKIRAVTTRQGVAKAAAAGRCVYSPEVMFPGDSEAGFVWFAEFVWQFCQKVNGVKIFGADEIQSLCPPAEALPKPLRCIAQMGRRHEIDTFFCTLALNECHNKLRGMSSHLFAFQTTDSLQLKAARGYFPTENLPGLRPGHYFRYDANKGERGAGCVSWAKGKA